MGRRLIFRYFRREIHPIIKVRAESRGMLVGKWPKLPKHSLLAACHTPLLCQWCPTPIRKLPQYEPLLHCEHGWPFRWTMATFSRASSM